MTEEVLDNAIDNLFGNAYECAIHSNPATIEGVKERAIRQFKKDIKRVGYKSPEECGACADGFISTHEQATNAIHAKYKGYVKLAKNQSLPPNVFGGNEQKGSCWHREWSRYNSTQQDMLRAGFRKVELEEVKDG